MIWSSRIINMKKKSIEKNEIIKDLLYENEINVNKRACYISLAIFIIICILYFSPNLAHDLDPIYTNFVFLVVSITSIAYIIVCKLFGGRKPWIKYLFILSFVLFTSAFLRTAELAVCLLLMVIPLAYSCLYYSKKITLFVGIVTITIFLVNVISNIYFKTSLYHDLNYVVVKEPTSVLLSGNLFESLSGIQVDTIPYLHNMLLYLIFPITFLYIITINICLFIVDKEEHLVYEHALKLEKEASQKKELELASIIQTSMLPLNDIKSYNNVSAFIKPAKEVGGDFYDCFMIDDNHIVLVIGDVSDKGVPAALFMSRCKTLLNTYARLAIGSGASFSETNKKLCQNNTSNMFVTAFMCIIDIANKKMEYVNAGHCDPIIKKNNGKYEYLDTVADLFLGGMNDEEYHETIIDFNIGDSIFLYTDGITEAEGADGLYGKKRLLSVLNNNLDKTGDALLECILKDIYNYSTEIEQSDDITMLWYSMEE